MSLRTGGTTTVKGWGFLSAPGLACRIERACVWIAVPDATVIAVEVVKVLLAPERSVRETLLGAKQGA
jgi:propanediol dehydratase small subunit